MNCIEADETTQIQARTDCQIEMPLGLLGFEQFKSYTLLSRKGEEPFLRFRAVENPKLGFIVMSPFLILPTYAPEISGEDTKFLGLQTPEDALLLSIVTVRGPQQATINLKGPIVLNRHTLLAKQAIPINASDLPVTHPLPLQAR